MDVANEFEIFLVAPPGLEAALFDEARAKDFRSPKIGVGGVTVHGGWPEVWRANLQLRGVTRVLVRLAAFRAMHLAQLDRRARDFSWRAFLKPDAAFRVEATCRSSRIYHSGAAAQRIERAIAEELGTPPTKDAKLVIKARIEDDLCTISIDSSGESLHKRGHKEEVGKAPIRETMASLFLQECGFEGHEPVVDPMCGSGTVVIEAAEIAMGLQPGRGRTFAFELLASFDAAIWNRMRQETKSKVPNVQFHGSDRDAGAIRMSRANADRAGVSQFTVFRQQPVSDLMPQDGPPGLVFVNPPYGARIGDRKPLFGLYGALGKVLLERFSGWRVGLVTTDASLAKATGLPFGPSGRSIMHGGLRVTLHKTSTL